MLFFFGRPSRGRLGSLLPQYVAESLFSSDNLAGGGPAAAHFLWSRPKISKQRKATATTSPLRGSRRCGVTIGRAANSLRSNMRLAAHCEVDVPPSLITLSTCNDRPPPPNGSTAPAAQCAASGFGLIRFEPGQ